MPINTECPLCATKGQVPSAFSGKKVKCPKCCNLFVVTGPATGQSALGNQKLTDSQMGQIKLAGSQMGNMKLPASQPGTQKQPGSKPGTPAKPGSQPGAPAKPGSHPGSQPRPGSQPGNQKLPGTHHGTQKKPLPEINKAARRGVPTQEFQLPPDDHARPSLNGSATAGARPASQGLARGALAAEPSPRTRFNPAALLLGVVALLLALSALSICWIPEVSTYGLYMGGAGLAIAGLGLLVGLATHNGIGLNITSALLCGGAMAVPLVLPEGEDARKTQDTRPDTSTEPRPTTPTHVEPPVVEEWIDVTKGVGKVGDMRIKVLGAEIDSVKGKDGKPITPKEQQLAIRIEVTNEGGKPVEYRGAGDPATKIGDLAPRLTDSDSTPYRVMNFGKDKPIQGQLPTAPAAPAAKVLDVLVFEPPGDKAAELRLELPGANFGGAGKVKLKIPRAFVVGKVKPPDPTPDKNIQQLLAELKSPNPKVRLDAATGLGTLGPKAATAVPDLALLLKDPDFNVSVAAAIALGKIGPLAKQAIPQLRDALKHAQTKVRGASALALGQFGADAKVAVPQLIGLFNDPDPETSQRAFEAVKRIEGMK